MFRYSTCSAAHHTFRSSAAYRYPRAGDCATTKRTESPALLLLRARCTRPSWTGQRARRRSSAWNGAQSRPRPPRLEGSRSPPLVGDLRGGFAGGGVAQRRRRAARHAAARQPRKRTGAAAGRAIGWGEVVYGWGAGVYIRCSNAFMNAISVLGIAG